MNVVPVWVAKSTICWRLKIEQTLTFRMKTLRQEVTTVDRKKHMYTFKLVRKV